MAHENDIEAPRYAAQTPHVSEQSYPGSGSYHEVSGRDIAALLNPRPLVLIGAHTTDSAVIASATTPSSIEHATENSPGESCFATVAWITPVSHDPAMLTFALRARSRTMEVLSAEGVFSVCTLGADTEGIALAELCGNRSGHHEHKGALVPHKLTSVHLAPPRKTTRTTTPLIPIVDAALSWLACSVNRIEDVGDHLLVIGTVLSAGTQCAYDEKGRVAAPASLLCIQHDTFAASNPLHTS